MIPPPPALGSCPRPQPSLRLAAPQSPSWKVALGTLVFGSHPAESFATSLRLIRTRPCRPIGVCSGAAPWGEVQVLRSPASILEHQIYPFCLSKGIGFGNSRARKRTPWGAGSGRLWTLQVSRPSPFPSTAPSGLRVTAVVRAAQVLEMVAQETSGGFNSSAGEKPGGGGWECHQRGAKSGPGSHRHDPVAPGEKQDTRGQGLLRGPRDGWEAGPLFPTAL